MPGARFLVDHRFTRRHLSAYVERDLEDFRLRRVERHLAECPECDHMLRSLQCMLGALAVMYRCVPTRLIADVRGRLRAIALTAQAPASRRVRPQR